LTELRLLQTDFSAGELDPHMFGRVGENIYSRGAASLRNVLPLNTGGAQTRPGTERLVALPSRVRLISFEFSADEKYVIGIADEAMHIYDPDGTLLQSFSSGDCPWDADQVWELTHTQAANTMFIAHRAFMPKRLLRTSLTTFTLTDYAFDTSPSDRKSYQPFFKFADKDLTISPSGTTGSITLTASDDLFENGHIGARFLLGNDEVEITAVATATSATATVKAAALVGLYDLEPFRVENGSQVVEVTQANHGFSNGASITISGANAVGGITAVQLNGAQTITVLDEDRYEFTSAGTATSSVDGGGPSVKFDPTGAATQDWAEQAFSPVRGYPGAVTLHDNRLWFGGSTEQPAGIWSSRVGSFFNFDIAEGEDDASIQIEVGASKVSNIKHMLSNRHLQVFTETSEFFLPQGNGGITPSAVAVRRQTSYGSSNVNPVAFDGATIFAQQNAQTIREYLFQDSEAAYRSVHLNIAASHLVNDVFDMAAMQGNTVATEQYCMIVNGDGTMAVFVSARDEKFAAWVPWDTPGAAFDSVCVLDTSAYVSVLRGGVYYLEKFSQDSADNILDSMTAFNTPGGSTTWTVGAEYANETVAVLSAGFFLGSFTVSGAGVLTLESWQDPEDIEIGFAYDFVVKTLPVDAAFSFGSLAGEARRLSRVTLVINETIGVVVDGQKMSLYNVGSDILAAPVSRTGIKQFYLRGWSRNPQITITQEEPFSVTLLGLNMEFTA